MAQDLCLRVVFVDRVWRQCSTGTPARDEFCNIFGCRVHEKDIDAPPSSWTPTMDFCVKFHRKVYLISQLLDSDVFELPVDLEALDSDVYFYFDRDGFSGS